MQVPTQGGLGQVSQKPAIPAGAAFDPDAKQAENVESQTKTTGLKDSVISDLGDQREALNKALLQMRQSLDARKNRLFDPVLMQAAAGFLKPTKTGSFGESLGYAAENAGAASERDQANQRENLKLEAELTEKEMAFRTQNRIADYRLGKLGYPIPGAKPSVAPAGAPIGASAALPGNAPQSAPAGSPVPFDLSNMRPGQFPPSGSSSSGRFGSTGAPVELALITDKDIQESYLVDPSGKLAKEMIEEAKLQREDILPIDGKPFSKSRQKFLPGSPDTMVKRDFGIFLGPREVTAAFAAQYDAVDAEARRTNNPKLLFDFLRQNNFLEPSKNENDKPETLDQRKNREEREKASDVETAKIRAKASEDRGNSVLARGENALNMEALANDVLSLTDSNTRAFNLMQNATVRDAVLRSIEQGASASAGPIAVSINLPVRIALQGNKEYQLTRKDIEALQLFQQKQSAITAEMRKMSRSSGEGATDKVEGLLYAAIGILPSDSARVLALKSEAMIQRARYDSRIAQVWSQFQDENPNKSFTYFQHNNSDFKEVQKNYLRTLNEMREKNSDILRTSPKAPAAASAAAAPAAPSTPAPAAPAASAPANDPSVPPGYIRDKTTKVIRKKLAGE